MVIVSFLLPPLADFCSSGALSISRIVFACAMPFAAQTIVIAEVRVVLPWST